MKVCWPTETIPAYPASAFHIAARMTRISSEVICWTMSAPKIWGRAASSRVTASRHQEPIREVRSDRITAYRFAARGLVSTVVIGPPADDAGPPGEQLSG